MCAAVGLERRTGEGVDGGALLAAVRGAERRQAAVRAAQDATGDVEQAARAHGRDHARPQPLRQPRFLVLCGQVRSRQPGAVRRDAKCCDMSRLNDLRPSNAFHALVSGKHRNESKQYNRT